jgi:hypothetical protein
MGIFHAPNLYPVRKPQTMQMRQVKPYPAFVNGSKITVENINVQSIFDDLESNVTFKYTLFDLGGQWAGEGVHSLGPDTYNDWDASVFGAYEIVAKGIGLTLLQTGGVTNPGA